MSTHRPLCLHGAGLRKDDVIQIRTSRETKAILNRAASLRGQKLSEFVLETARQRAEEALLDQRLFLLDDKEHRTLLALLDRPVKPSASLRARMKRKKAWDR